jgi:BlaI family transcriptional regulator, penicillinase repressor
MNRPRRNAGLHNAERGGVCGTAMRWRESPKGCSQPFIYIGLLWECESGRHLERVLYLLRTLYYICSMPSRNIQLTPRELDVMSILWRRDGTTISEIREQLPDVLAPQTIHTILRLLEEKACVRRELGEKANLYFARVSPNDAGDSALQRLVSKVYHGSRSMLVSRLIADQDLSAAELRRMQALIRERLRDTES